MACCVTMKYDLPKTIQCNVCLNGMPFQGGLLIATFSTKAKNSYSIIFGPIDISGGAGGVEEVVFPGGF